MSTYGLFLALHEFDSITDIDFEISGSREDVLALVEKANAKRAARAHNPAETSESLADVDKGTETEGRKEIGVGSGSQISGLLADYVGKISAYHGLALLVSAMGPVLVGNQVKKDLYDRADSFAELEKKDGYTIYGVRDDQVPDVNASLEKMLELVRGMKVLPESVLLSLVATFDSYIASIALGLLKTQPGRYDDEKKLVSVKSIMSMESFDDVISMLAEQEVQDCMRGSHSSQVNFLENLADVKIKEHYERWADFVEIFERRNLVAHQSMQVNSLYITNCKQAGLDTSGLKVGDVLKLDAKYLMSSVNILLEFGILLLLVVWRKRFRNDADGAFVCLNEIAYNLIRRNHALVASRILEFGLFKQSRKAKDVTIKMMIVNLSNCYKKLNNPQKVEETLSSMDWSSANAQFLISIAAVRDDVDKVIELIPQVKDEAVIGKFGFRFWPVFDSVRANPRFREAFEKAFNEPLGAPDVAEAGAEATNLAEEQQQAGEGSGSESTTLTVH